MSKDDLSGAPPVLGGLEREVMEQLWREGEATVRVVLRALNLASGRERAYTTVMTVMGNLHRKGLLRRRRAGRTDVYTPALDRDAYTEARVRADVDALVARYGDVAYAHFAREVARLDPERRERLRQVTRRE